MSEERANLTQRVEALEQISHARVVERIGQIEQRVSRIESAREAEEPHVATKADIARLETSCSRTHSRTKPAFTVSTTIERNFRLLIAWRITLTIALMAVVIAATAFIVTQLS